MAKTMFYNPKVSAIGIDVSIVSNSIQLEIARAINPQAQGRPKAGQKVYDWEAKAFFSLTSDECARIDANLNQVLDGSYKDVKASDPKYAHVFSLTHFREGKPSRFSIQRAQDHQGNPIQSVTISITPPGGNSFFYPLREEELLIWRWLIKSGYQRLPYDSAFVDAIEKKKRKEAFDKQNSQSQGQGQNNYNNNNQGGGYKQPPPQESGPTFDDQPQQNNSNQQQSPPPQENNNNNNSGVNDIDFDF